MIWSPKRKHCNEGKETLVKSFGGSIRKAIYIAKKDARIYFFKWPNITFGLLLPAIIYFAFAVGKSVDIPSTIPGLVAMAALFGAGAIQSVALPLERATGTFDRLLAAPISLNTILVGKILAGFFFGMIISAAYSLIVIALSGAVITYPVHFCLGITITVFAFSVLGVCISAPFNDIPTAMPPATLLRVLMVFLGGVLIPVVSMPDFLQVIAYLLPVTYAVEILHQTMAGPLGIHLFLQNIAVLLAFTLVYLYLAGRLLKRTIH